ncbi:MAG: bifunctional lysine ketoglutarate reductase /saccharopine dehydrogenase family protein [Bacteroidales bacterium]|nr:bifunctional lysine ketoglutarate reductase /saccharopine dehydrogenase family protein [Bacteroidales bacterium]
MTQIIGIRNEDKYLMERRVAIIPEQVSELVSKGIDVHVERSPKRVFTHAEYEAAGALVTDSLEDARLIFGVKEIPLSSFEPSKTYVFFSHVIKGQSYNMPMLKQMMSLGCNLIDYEKIENEHGRRLIFFGRFAGLAGAINSFWALGQRLKVQGIDNPFQGLRQSYNYGSLDEAVTDIAKVGEQISRYGLPSTISPLIIGITGYGNVSLGAQEIVDELPYIEIDADELLKMDMTKASSHHVYKIVFKKQDLSRHKDPSQSFDPHMYSKHPEDYVNNFERFVPRLSVLLNCMYWDSRFPRLITKDYLEVLYSQAEPKLKVIGDITCDPDGSIEATHKGMGIDEPVFVYDPFTRKPQLGFDGKGILIMAVDILPSELPKEASQSFSQALFPYVERIARADFDLPYEQLALPDPIKKALILHKGKLTPPYTYLDRYL